MGTVQAVVGNPKAASRTADVARRTAERCARRLGLRVAPVIELAPLAGEIFEWGSDAVAEAKRAVLDADLVVVASPTYKAAYTGLTKAFLDRFAAGELAGRPCIALMTAGSPHHALAVEVHLRPVLVEIGATVVSPGLAVTEADLEAGTGWLDEWLDLAGPVLDRLFV